MTVAVFEKFDAEEAGGVDFKLKRGLDVRKYEIRKSYSERGTEISGEVGTVADAARLLEKLFELAGIE